MAFMNPLVILCVTCQQPLQRVDVVEQTEQGPRMEFYQCEAAGCAGKLAVIFELSGALAAPAPGFIEREVGRRGAFFPTDYSQGRGRRNW